MVRPQNKKRKELQNMRDSLKKGQSIVTIGGIHGKISDVHESTVTVIVDSNTKIKVDKSSISFFVHDNIYLFSHYSKLQNRKIDNTRHPISHSTDCKEVSRERFRYILVTTK